MRAEAEMLSRPREAGPSGETPWGGAGATFAVLRAAGIVEG